MKDFKGLGESEGGMELFLGLWTYNFVLAFFFFSNADL